MKVCQVSGAGTVWLLVLSVTTCPARVLTLKTLLLEETATELSDLQSCEDYVCISAPGVSYESVLRVLTWKWSSISRTSGLNMDAWPGISARPGFLSSCCSELPGRSGMWKGLPGWVGWACKEEEKVAKATKVYRQCPHYRMAANTFRRVMCSTHEFLGYTA